VQAEDFVMRVLLPLTGEGALVVRAPIDADDLKTLLAERSTMAGVAALAEARHAIAAHYLRDAEAPSLDEDSIRLGAAIHNLCWLLAQPRHEAQRGAHVRVAGYTARLCELAPAADDDAVMARHTLVGRIRGLQRRDVKIRFWAGHREFRGEQPPKRLLRWQTVRRVRQDATTVDLFATALRSSATTSIVAALLQASPLTDLLDLDRGEPPIALSGAARWLRSPRIARALADEYLRRGLTTVEARLTAALFSLYDKSGAADASASATAFHSHLHLLELISRPARDREGHLQILRGYAQGQDRAIVDGFGLFAAADRVGLGRPVDLVHDRALHDNVDAYAEACAELVGVRRLQQLVALIARGAGEHARVS
jgi:hypothetical protein